MFVDKQLKITELFWRSRISIEQLSLQIIRNLPHKNCLIFPGQNDVHKENMKNEQEGFH